MTKIRSVSFCVEGGEPVVINTNDGRIVEYSFFDEEAKLMGFADGFETEEEKEVVLCLEEFWEEPKKALGLYAAIGQGDDHYHLVSPVDSITVYPLNVFDEPILFRRESSYIIPLKKKGLLGWLERYLVRG